MNTPATVLILCEHSVAFVRRPNLYDAMRAIVEEGIAELEPETTVGVVNFGNRPDDSCFWTLAREFDAQRMYGERCLGVANIYNAVNLAVGEHLNGRGRFVLVVCTYCGSSDLPNILYDTVRQRVNGLGRCAVIYADEHIHMPLSDLSISVDTMFTAGFDAEIARFVRFLRETTASRSIHQERAVSPDDRLSSPTPPGPEGTRDRGREYIDDEFS